jgi:hypothetical protein
VGGRGELNLGVVGALHPDPDGGDRTWVEGSCTTSTRSGAETLQHKAQIVSHVVHGPQPYRTQRFQRAPQPPLHCVGVNLCSGVSALTV